MGALLGPSTGPPWGALWGPQDGPRGLQDAEDGLQDGLQDGADGPKVPTCTLTKRPRRPRRTQTAVSVHVRTLTNRMIPVMADVPRGLQDRPRGLQDGPMTAQEAPKTAPRGPQDGPRDPEGLLRASLPLKQKDSSAHTIRRCTILLIILYFSAFGDAMMRILLPHARSHRVWNFSLLHLRRICVMRIA